MITYANLIKHHIFLLGMFSNIAKLKISLTEQNKNKKRKNKNNQKCQWSFLTKLT